MGETVVLDKPKETIYGWEFPVLIGQRRYLISVQKEYWRTLIKEKIPVREFVFRSVLFLLEREPKESILSSFDLQDISAYFPEYEKVMKGNLVAN